MKQRARKPTDVFLEHNPDSGFQLPHIEFNSNCCACVEGCKGIIEYDGNVVRINCGHILVKFCGDNLSIRALSTDRISVNGIILSVEFCS
ncbi:MAG: YabP/YqfC family sporulation protein [Faecalibacterium sp.]|nr:YabP/YqfC family sporulation protein [Ruminococcus sp.]MCM1391633.1 YabP/YqfC family sporulation protein [Ruminococcus sp.]MCM1485758.1 YabP/YqfC family sporulation protein [Faecalibacterium sp.]